MSEHQGAEETGQETEAKTYDSLNFYANEAGGTEEEGTGDFIHKDDDDEKLGPEEIAFMYHVIFGTLADRRGDHWALSDKEALKLGKATDRVLQKYIPDIQTGPEVSLVLAATLVAAPRLMADRAIAEQQDQDDQAGTDGD